MYLQVVPSIRQRQLNRPGSTTPPAGLLSSMPPPSGCTALVSRLSLHLHCIDTAPSLQPHSTLAKPLVHLCCTFTAHCTLTANSLHPQCAGTPTSLHSPCTHTALSRHCNCVFTTPSLHCTLATLSLHPHCIVLLCDRFCDVRRHPGQPIQASHAHLHGPHWLSGRSQKSRGHQQ